MRPNSPAVILMRVCVCVFIVRPFVCVCVCVHIVSSQL